MRVKNRRAAGLWPVPVPTEFCLSGNSGVLNRGSPLLKFRIGDKSFLLKASITFLEGWSLEKGFTNKLACSSLPGVLGVFCQSFSQESTGKGEAQDHRCALHRELRPGGCSGGVRHSLFAWRRWLGAWHCTGCSVV